MAQQPPPEEAWSWHRPQDGPAAPPPRPADQATRPPQGPPGQQHQPAQQQQPAQQPQPVRQHQQPVRQTEQLTLPTPAPEPRPQDRQRRSASDDGTVPDPAPWLSTRALVIIAGISVLALLITIVVCLLLWITPPMQPIEVPSAPEVF